MNFLSSLSSTIIAAGTSALAGAAGGVPGVPGYTIGDKVTQFEGKTIWSLYEGVKKDDSSLVSIFTFDAAAVSPSNSYSNNIDRRALLPLARNSLRKLRTLRHPNVLKFLDGTETDTAVWIITEHVRSLAVALNDRGGGLSEESNVYGLLHLITALSFLNREGGCIHGNVRPEAIWITNGGEWKLGGMEVCTKRDDEAGVLWSSGGVLPDSRTFASPEVRKGGWTSLKEHDTSSLDSYQLHLLLFTLFNGPLPVSFSTSSDVPPSLPTVRGSIPQSLFQAWRRLGNPNPKPRLNTTTLLELGLARAETTGGGWWPNNRLVKLSSLLEGFSLASESERAGLIRSLKELEVGKTGAGVGMGNGATSSSSSSLPDEFVKYKVLPSLVRAFEFGGGGGGGLLPLILSLAGGLPEKEYSTSIIQPLIRMFATPDRAMRMALLEGLDKFADKLTQKDVSERIWPHLLTGFGDAVPIIREATVKSILLIAPKLNERILNNDLLRHLAKTQTDPEPGIRTNTCILLGRLSKVLQPSTSRKVLIPAFARALRDPFVHARIAGLMALMATADCYEKEDLAGKVIPSMSICLVDRERAVRDQGYKAMDMFVKKCEALTADMPDVTPVENGQQTAAFQAASQNQPGLATNAAGAAGALAGWAFASVTKKVRAAREQLVNLGSSPPIYASQLSAADLEAPIDRSTSVPPPATNGDSSSRAAVAAKHPLSQAAGGSSTLNRTSSEGAVRTSSSPLSLPGGFGTEDDDEAGTEDWGGDLMDVNDDDGDWNGFETAPPRVDPLAARLASRSARSPAARRGGALKLGTKSSALRVPMDMDATDNWDIEEPTLAPAPSASAIRAVAAKAAAATKAQLHTSTPSPSPSVAPKIIVSTRPTLAPSPAAPPRTPSPISAPRPPATPPLPKPSAPPTAAVADESWADFDDTPSASRQSFEAAAPLTKEEKAAKMAAAREERRARMAKGRVAGGK